MSFFLVGYQSQTSLNTLRVTEDLISLPQFWKKFLTLFIFQLCPIQAEPLYCLVGSQIAPTSWFTILSSTRGKTTSWEQKRRTVSFLKTRPHGSLQKTSIHIRPHYGWFGTMPRIPAEGNCTAAGNVLVSCKWSGGKSIIFELSRSCSVHSFHPSRTPYIRQSTKGIHWCHFQRLEIRMTFIRRSSNRLAFAIIPHLEISRYW